MSIKLFITNVCEKITKYSLYTLVFLLPLFFLPWTSTVLDFNKQALLIFLSGIALFCWMLKSFLSGVFEIKFHKITIAVAGVGLAYLISTIFSVSKYASFWGSGQIISESFISVLCFGIIYFLVGTTFFEKEIFTSFYLLGVSVLLAIAYAIFQLFGLYIIPFAFAKSYSFNTVGSVGSLGMLVSALLPWCIMLSITAKKWWKLLFAANTALILFFLVLVNYQVIWCVALAGSALVMFFWSFNRDMFDGRLMFLPVFFMAVSLFFIFYNPPVNLLPQKPMEVSLSQKTNVIIDGNALKSAPLQGSGPGTFNYDFQKFKSRDFNNDTFWNVSFSFGASKFLTNLATTGLLGALAMLLLLSWLVFCACKVLIFEKSNIIESASFGEMAKSPVSPILQLALISAMASTLLAQSLGFFLYNSNVSLDFVFFFFTGALVALIYKNKKTYQLASHSLLTLAITAAITLVLIAGLAIFYLQVQRYIGDVYYQKSLQAFVNGQKDDAIVKVKSAASYNASAGSYFNSLAVFSLSSLQDQLANATSAPSDGQKKKVTALVSDSIAAINTAVAIAPKNVDNWSMRGYICNNLTGFLTDAFDCAIASYDKAIELSPANPYLFLQQGSIYATQYQSQKSEALLFSAREKFKKAIELKQDYALAYFEDALAARLQNNAADQSADLAKAQTYSSKDPASLLQIGVVYYQDKNWAKSQEQFLKALAIIPNYADALYYYGLTSDQLGQKDNAIRAFSKLLETNSQNPTVQKILANLKAGTPALTGLGAPAPIPPASK